ncbi:APOBEC1 complementation factor-like [Procambarus clarkii]|uniref:APOBEC1 complementation factor-like n=1 Tax=Procambarus clarkii TaxID=6728 RepID=UPI001E672CC3|nr:APOBEC1 complementation factor-like [Procambarus clarkii]
MEANHSGKSNYELNWSKAKHAADLVFMRKGYSIVLQNGQRVYGPCPGWSGPVPERGSEVFVGRLPRDLYEDQLLPVLEQAGAVYQLRLLMDFTGTTRGYAFVTYANPKTAYSAIKLLTKYEIRPGVFLSVKQSADNNRLYLGNLPASRTRQEVLQEMERLTDGVTKVIMYQNVYDRSKNRRFAFVEYESHRAASLARRKLFSQQLTIFGSPKIIVDWAKPMEDEASPRMRKMYNLDV